MYFIRIPFIHWVVCIILLINNICFNVSITKFLQLNLAISPPVKDNYYVYVGFKAQNALKLVT